MIKKTSLDEVKSKPGTFHWKKNWCLDVYIEDAKALFDINEQSNLWTKATQGRNRSGLCFEVTLFNLISEKLSKYGFYL